MKLLLVACAVIAVTQALSLSDLVKQEWHAFKLQHGKKYSSAAEEELRMQVYLENKQKIAEHNAKYEKGEVTFTVGMNHFGDLRHEEFMKMMNGYNSTLGEQLHKLGTPHVTPANVQVPATIDWRESGAVTEVKNQGQCGSCWAFSATGTMEGQHFRATGQLVSLSEQNLMDCTTQNNACNGGVVQYGFIYTINNHGVDTEASYPYEAKLKTCRYNAKNSGATMSSYVNIQGGNETQLAEAVANIGPVSVAMDARGSLLQFYKSGIYYYPECSTNVLTHAVLAVGYNTLGNGSDYWIIKNSWGSNWGEKGYFNMYRNKNNQCGVATQASYPLV